MRNIGIFAHVDAGKTTLTEQMLLTTGAIRKAGRVDAGTAHTDSLAVERQRGISVRSGTVCVRYEGYEIRIIDTPGHVDFSSEVETALLAVDGAVLLVSAVEGVQAQTEVIYRVLSALGIPTLVFINKIDRAGADVAGVLLQIAQQMPLPIDMRGEGLIDSLSRVDDLLLEQALDGTADGAAIRAAAARCCRAGQMTPVLTGSALKGVGIEALLAGICDYLPAPQDAGGPSAAAYHVRHVGEERQVRVRVFGGEIRVGPVEGFGRIRRLRVQTPQGERNVDALRPGDIGIAVGLEGLLPGGWIGAQVRGRPAMQAPVLRAQVLPADEARLPAVIKALTRMQDEHGSLFPTYEQRTRSAHVQVIGEIHRQVVEQSLREDYGIDAALTPPEVIYRETPVGRGQGSIDMMYDPWSARATFVVEPAPRGSGIAYVDGVHVDRLHAKYHPTIKEAALNCLNEGLMGWQVTDLTLTLTAAQGSFLMWGGASSKFGPVVPLAVFAALQQAGVRLLEPVMRFTLHADEGACSALLYELSLIRADCEPIRYRGGAATISGLVPVGTCGHFASKVSELTGGRGSWRTTFDGYRAAPDGVGGPMRRTTPDPGNPQLYIDIITGRVQW